VRASWALLAVEAMIDPEPQTFDEQYEFHIENEVFHIDVPRRDGSHRGGPAAEPVVTVTTDAATFVRIGCREVRDGDGDAVLRACAVLGLDTWAVARETA